VYLVRKFVDTFVAVDNVDFTTLPVPYFGVQSGALFVTIFG